MLLAVNTTLHLLQLRSLMVNLTVTGMSKELSAYIIPLADAHNGERIASCDQRLRYISGFSGSAGSAIVTQNSDAALLWTDGRYFTQAEEELDMNWELMREGIPGTLTQAEYLNRNLAPGSAIGVDPSLYSKVDFDNLQSSLRIGGHILQPVERNLVDMVWSSDRPNCPASPVYELEIEFTGRNTTEKLADIRREMQLENADAVVLSELDEIAWLLNLRGSDLSSASVFISYLIILEDKFQLFINPVKLNDTIKDNLTQDDGEFYNYEDVVSRLTTLVGSTSGKIWFSNKCNYALVRRVPEPRQIVKLTPLALMKAVKNDVEVSGYKEALIRDAAALSRFLHWVEDTVTKGENVSEISASERLLEFRRENKNFISTSFTTISATGPNGAIIHYRPTIESNTVLSRDAMYLVDSGAIYKDGTTDITRTLHFGTPTDFQKECYTRVLKGQIAIATSTFPNKLRGSRVDSFARRALWSFGLDYNHGTGHGIGHALNVHEGPSAIKERYVPDDQGLRENMFTSNEPGYYQVNEFGIRLENIVRVVNVTLPYNFQNQGFLGFEDLTFVPYQHKLIKTELLTQPEIEYLNKYQDKVRQIVAAFVQENYPADPTYDWILRETQPFIFQAK